jgi:hypothetical protein
VSLFGTRLGTRFGTKLGTQFPPGGGGGGAPSFSGVVDNVIAAGGTVAAAYSLSHQSSAAQVTMILVRRASDNAVADISRDAATHRLNLVELAAHCGASDGYIVTIYDGSGNGRDVTQATTSRQLKIYDSATGVVLQGSLPYPQFVAASLHSYSRGDACGLSGASALTMALFVSSNSVARRMLMTVGVGTSAVDDHVYVGVEATTGDPLIGVDQLKRRNFTNTEATTSPSFLVYQHPASSLIAATTARQNGAAIAFSSGADISGGTVQNIGAGFHIGARNAAGANSQNGGGGCFWLMSGSVLAGAALAALEAHRTELDALAV